ncbi:MAG: hypothetical protein V4617_10795 [Gemmatimonadota bacterium]
MRIAARAACHLVTALAVVSSLPPLTRAAYAQSSALPYVHRLSPTHVLETVIEDAPGRKNVLLVRMENQGPVPIIVTEVTLTHCINVLLLCGPHKKEHTIAPKRRKTLLEIEPGDERTRPSFRYSYQARSASQTATLGALADAGDSSAARRLSQINHADSAFAAGALSGDRTLSSNELIALGSLITLRADPDTIVLPVGGTAFPGQFRVVAVNGDGRTVGRLRAPYQFSLQGGRAVTFVRPDTLRAIAPGRQTFTMRFNPALSASRATPFPDVMFTIIVR